MNKPRKVVVVLGMHRSGTSLVAGLLQILGVRLGTRLVPPRGDNPRGFFEHEDIVAIHKRINRILKRRPMSITGHLDMPDDWPTFPALAEHREQLAALLMAETAAAGDGLWGFKDPHTVRLLPLWQQIFQEQGVEPVYLLSLRHPAAVAESLRRRDNVRRDHAELLWLQHYLAALGTGAGNIAGVFEYERWFDDFDARFQHLVATLGIGDGDAGTAIVQARRFVERGLDHSADAGPVDNPLAAKLYRALQDFCASKLDDGALDRIAGEIHEAMRSFQLWSEIIDNRLLGPQTPAEPPQTAIRRQLQTGRDSIRFETLATRLARDGDFGDRVLDVCVLTYELEGPVRNTGMASESADMAIGLARMGHQVTVLYVPRHYCEDDSFDHWVAYYRERGVELVGLGTRADSSAKWMKEYKAGSELLLCRPGAYNVYQWLKWKRFDVVHSFDTRGALFYTLLAKRLDPDFSETIFHVRAYGPDKLRKRDNAEPMHDVQELSTAYMERQVVELADIVTAPSASMFIGYLQENYACPADRSLVVPYIGCHHELPPRAASARLREIVFFGSLEPRKGLNLFVDGINWLHRHLDAVRDACGGELPAIRFIGGQHGAFPGADFLKRRTAKWLFPVDWDLDQTRLSALSYLSGGGRLAVLAGAGSRPSLCLAECLQYGIPFLAADTAANRAMLGNTDAADVLFDRHPKRLAAMLLQVLASGRRPEHGSGYAVDAGVWEQWHRSLSHSLSPWRRRFYYAPAAKAETPPLVSVCVAHFNRPRFLRQCLASLEAQSYGNIEVVIVDDGSTDPEAVAYLTEIEPALNEKGWRIIRQDNRYLGAVRNTGARNARGKYCLFMDDDNYAKPNEIESFVTIAERTGADILTCFADVFSGDDPPDTSAAAHHTITQLGANLPMGLFRNGFGDSNCFVQREFFLAVGGNSEDYKVGRDDQEFFARAVLNGARLLLVPEPLYWYRETEVRMRSLHYNTYAGDLRVLRPYLDACHPLFRDIFRFAQGQMIAFQRYRGAERFRRQRVVQELQKVLDSGSWRLTRPLRAALRRLTGKTGAEVSVEQAEQSPQPALLLARVYASTSWQLTWPLRVLRRLPGVAAIGRWLGK